MSYFKVDRPEEYTPIHTRWPVKYEYAKLINSSRITFSCMSIFNYAVLKFFEIPACNSALFSDYGKQLKDLGFIPDKNMVRIDTGVNIKKFIRDWLKRPDELKEISQRGYEMVHEKHTTAKRAEEFIEYLEKL